MCIRDSEKPPAAPRWTDEEWAEWRHQQDQHWIDCEKWYAEQEAWRTSCSASNDAFAKGIHEELIKHNAQAANTDRRLKMGEEKIKDLVEATTILTQYAKEAQVDTATKQLKVLGWRKESREERKTACD
eukprot:10100677-Alexandrium_andersonii.AAC.1